MLLRICFLIALLSGAMTVADEFPRRGEWPSFRGNGTLDGHAQGVGHIRTPQIVWRHRFGSTLTRLAVSPASGENQLSIPNADQRPAGHFDATRWFPPGPAGEIAGRHQPIVPTDTTTYADILPDVPGLEKIEFASGFQIPTKNGRWQYGPGRLLSWRDNAWAPVWEKESIDHSFRPLPLVGDFDADGELEIAVLPWRAVHIYDAVTGELEQKCEFTKGRSYGSWGAYDLNRDGFSEFLVMSDFAKHIEVLGYRNGELVLRWQHEIELDISNPQKMHRVLAEPVADLEGDGRPELLVNLFNDQGDKRWHLTVYDALDGTVRSDMEDRIAQGVADLDGDGAVEILAAGTNGQHIPPLGKIQILKLKADGMQTIWEANDMAWQCQETPLTLHQQNGARFARVAALVRAVDGRDRVVTQRRSKVDPSALELAVQHWDGAQLQSGPTLIAPHAEVLALDADGAMLAAVRSPPGSSPTVRALGGKIEVLTSGPDTMRLVTPPAVVRCADRETPLVVVQDTSLLAWSVFEPPTSTSGGKEIWRLMAQNPTSEPVRSDGQQPSTDQPIAALSAGRWGPVVANLHGDGQRQLLVAGATRRGSAQLSAVDVSTGNVLWSRSFERFSAGRNAWNIGGPLSWQAGYFTDSNRQDVLVTLQRSRMHSEETSMLSGTDGKQIWHRDRQIANRSFGGQPFAIADFDQNGLEDAASFYTHIRYIVDGATGDDLLAAENDWPEVPVRPVYWGQPVAVQCDASSPIRSLLFTTTGNQMVGRIRADGSLVWSDAYDEAANGFPAVGDFDADGQLEAIFFGFKDGTRCYDVVTGKLEWTLDFARDAHVRTAVSGDLDGDGCDEAVLVLGQRLYCVGTRAGADAATRQGTIRWQLELPAVVSSPILADLSTNNGVAGKHLAILVAGQDGNVYCINDADLRAEKKDR